MSITQDIRDAFSQRDNALNQFIVINVLVFAILAIIHAVLKLSGAESTYSVIQRQLELSSSLPMVLRHPWTMLTYAFVHEDFWHILFNMLNLYWFGQLIREYLGNRRLISLYILGALAGAVLFLLAYNLLPEFRGSAAMGIPLIGASASVVAIIMAAATLLPDYTFVMFLLGAVKIKWIAAVVIVVLSIQPIYNGNPGGGIAHLGGALLGYIFIKQLNRNDRDIGQPVIATGAWLGRLFQRRSAMQVTHRGAATATRSATTGKAAPNATHPEEVDLILDKISRSGYESLSKDEKQKLFRASQQ